MLTKKLREITNGSILDFHPFANICFSYVCQICKYSVFLYSNLTCSINTEWLFGASMDKL
jgi:hypothetical protein